EWTKMGEPKSLRTLQEDITIAVLRRPTLGLSMKASGLDKRHFPRDLQPAFHIATTKSQDEIRRLVMLQDPRVWPLYGKRIVEWLEGQARAVARQIVDSVERGDDHTPIDAVCHDDGSAAAAKMAAPTYEMPEKRLIFVKTRVIVDELARIEGGPWAEWGKGRKWICAWISNEASKGHE